MKIEDKRNGNNRVRFKDLKTGEVFADKDGDYLQKVVTSCHDNAVALETGVCYELEDDFFVTPLPNARLVIE